MSARQKWTALLGLLAAVTLLPALPAQAHGDPTAERKLERGVLNLFTGFGEIPYQIGQEARINRYRGWLVGLPKGIAWGVFRTLYGAWDTLTFPVPPYSAPILDPEILVEEWP